jgi:transcriptional regulator with XRE-family HTH domain
MNHNDLHVRSAVADSMDCLSAQTKPAAAPRKTMVSTAVLAARLKRLRTERGLSLSQLAAATGISSSFLSLLEQGKSDITIGRLMRLAEFYGLDGADFLASARTPADPIQLLSLDSAGTMMRSLTEGVELFELSAGARWDLVPLLAVFEEGGAIDTESTTDREVFVFVLEGTFEISFGSNPPTRVRTGEGAVYRSLRPYSVRNVGSGQGRMLALTTSRRSPVAAIGGIMSTPRAGDGKRPA